MDHPIVQPNSDLAAASTRVSRSPDAPVSATKDPVLSRLMEEVRNDRHVEARYDRVHNRHNRGR